MTAASAVMRTVVFSCCNGLVCSRHRPEIIGADTRYTFSRKLTGSMKRGLWLENTKMKDRYDDEATLAGRRFIPGVY